MDRQTGAPVRTAVPLGRLSLAEAAFAELRRQIADGERAPGDRLVIDQLAREFNISATPVREALARLRVDRLVDLDAYRGYRVARPLTGQELTALFEARAVVEVGSAVLAASRITDAAVAELTAINEAIREGHYGTHFDDFRAFVELNDRFHMAIVHAAQNTFLDSAFRRVDYAAQRSRGLAGRGIPDIALIVREHEGIIAALSEGDAEAVRASLSRHIEGGRKRLSHEMSAVIANE